MLGKRSVDGTPFCYLLVMFWGSTCSCQIKCNPFFTVCEHLSITHSHTMQIREKNVVHFIVDGA